MRIGRPRAPEREIDGPLCGGGGLEGLELRVGVLDGALGGRVARGRLRRLVLRRPRLRVGELVLERRERRLRLLDRTLELGLLALAVLRRPGGLARVAVAVAVAAVRRDRLLRRRGPGSGGRRGP